MTEASLTEPRAVIAAVDEALEADLDAAAQKLARVSPAAADLIAPIRTFAAGGKRIRALILWWGFELAGARAADSPGIARAGAFVELLHAAALIHDDIIDDSDTRRGRPALHAGFRTAHRAQEWDGDAELFGVGAGIIAGDLCLSLSEESLASSGLERLGDPEVRRRHADLRRDVMVGQYLDIRLQAAPTAAADIGPRANEVLTYKSAKYSVEQPLLLGAALGGAEQQLLELLSDFGLPLGRAFQLRDDELGVFGDPELTGKPAGDDLRQGKKTVLVGAALERLGASSPDDAAWFASRLGAPDLTADEIERMMALMTDCGALAELEAQIEEQMERSRGALDALAAVGDRDGAGDEDPARSPGTGAAARAGGTPLSDADRRMLEDYVLRLTRRSA